MQLIDPAFLTQLCVRGVPVDPIVLMFDWLGGPLSGKGLSTV